MHVIEFERLRLYSAKKKKKKNDWSPFFPYPLNTSTHFLHLHLEVDYENL